MTTPKNNGELIETPPVGATTTSELTEHALQNLESRIRQQEILSALGVAALKGATLRQLLDETAKVTAEGIRVEFCKVLEYLPAESCFIVRAGVGWDEGTIGVARVEADLGSPAGYALQTGIPVISNHLTMEARFRTPALLQRHGIHRAMNVILQGDGKPYGVLEVDSRSDTAFVEQDLAFLQGAANLLGMAIEHERQQRLLTLAAERDKVVLAEMSHRVKNSLSIVVSMLNLQARAVGSPELTRHLNDASRRVAAIAKAHDQLSHSANVDRMDIGVYLHAVCSGLSDSVAHCEVELDIPEGITVPTGHAISIALIINELMTNAAKYAYRDQRNGKIWISGRQDSASMLVLSVRDHGDGLPPDFDMQRATGLGMRIIGVFAEQLSAKITILHHSPGTEFVLTIPLEQPATGSS